MDRTKDSSFGFEEGAEVLGGDFAGARAFKDFLTELDSSGDIDQLEEGAALDFEKKIEEELGELELQEDFNDKTNDPVRMYLREMGTVPLLTREGEIELAKRIERGQRGVSKVLSRSTLVIREVLGLHQQVSSNPEAIVDILSLPEQDNDEEDDFTPQVQDFLNKLEDIERHYRKVQANRQKLLAISRSLKPKQHRSLRWAISRSIVQISIAIRQIQFNSSVRRHLIDELRRKVEELRPIEREVARLQRKIEEVNGDANGQPNCAARFRSLSAAKANRASPNAS